MKTLVTCIIMGILFLTGNKLVATQQKYTRSIQKLTVSKSGMNSLFREESSAEIKAANPYSKNRFPGEEISYSFDGNYTKNDVVLAVTVQDGSYWVKFAGKHVADDLACEFSGRAIVKKGRLHVRFTQPKQPVILILAKTGNSLIVRSAKPEVLDFCSGQQSLVGEYTKVQ